MSAQDSNTISPQGFVPGDALSFGATVNPSVPPAVSHFWVPSSPFMESALMLSAPLSSEVTGETNIEIFDPDGALVNRLSIGSSSHTPIHLELDPLMEGCKFESGMRHAHLIVSSHPSRRAMCRYYSRGGAILIPPMSAVTQDRAVFSPVALGSSKTGLVAMTNMSPVEVPVRCRLMLPNRNPDVIVNVPPHGARILCIEKEFREAILSGFGKRKSGDGEEFDEVIPEMRAYLRIAPKSENKVGIQYLEASERSDAGLVFTATGA